MKRMAVCFLCSVLLCFSMPSLNCSAVDGEQYFVYNDTDFNEEGEYIGTQTIGERFEENYQNSTSTSDEEDYGVSVMSLDGAQIYADNSLFAFGQIFKKVHETGVFVYHENLPYGLSTGIISFRCDTSIWNIYFNINTANALCFGNGSNSALSVLFLSNSAYYISRFSVETGKYQTFNGVQGIKSYSASDMLNYVTTTTYKEFYITISSNVYVTNSDGTIESGLYYYGDDVDFFKPVWYTATYLTYAKYQSDKLNATLSDISDQNQENYEALSEQALSLAEEKELADQERHEETGNWISNLGDRISGFFDNLLEGIKGIFVPDEDFFDSYQSDLQEFFKARLGVIYEVGDVVVSLLEKLVTYDPQDGNYVIEFPAVPAPSFNTETKEVEWHSLIPATTFSFSDLVSEGIFKTIYSAYIAMVKLCLVFMAIRLFSKKANEVFSGRSQDE